MWILPKQLHTLVTVQDTKALLSDLNECSQLCAQSLLARSKDLLAPIWLRKWKRDSWMQHLSGRILKPSLFESFADSWTSTLLDFLVSHFLPPESAVLPKTRAICTPSSLKELMQCSRESSSSKTSKESSAPSVVISPVPNTANLFSSMSSETWKKEVTAQRGEYSVRVKSVPRTSGSGSMSWPSARASDGEKGGPNQSGSKGDLMLPSAVNRLNWPTTTTTRDHKDGTAQSCKNVPTNGLLGRVIHLYSGPPDPAKLSTNGNHPEQWPTPEGMGGGKTSRGGNRKDELLLGGMVKEQWRTPSDPTKRGGSQPAEKRAEGGHTINLEDQVHTQGKLNPRWVETLMGLPVGWTMPSCATPEWTNSGCLETESCQQPPNELSECLPQD